MPNQHSTPASVGTGAESSAAAVEYDVRALTPLPWPAAPPRWLITVILTLRRWLLKLADSLLPAEAVIFERATGIGQTQVLGVMARHGIADLLHTRPMTASELATATGLNADALHRALRAAATVGIGELRTDGRFANNRLSEALRSGRLSRTKEFVEYFASHSNCAAYCAFDHVLRNGREGFAQANGMDLWEWFDHYPAERETFAQAMMGVTIGESTMVAKLYPFQEINKLCDVGGGRGTLLSELLIRFPHLQGVLFDREGVIESAQPLLRARGVAERVECVSGDFFSAVVPGCDAYLLKNVMHDWHDDNCRLILRNCRAAMQPGQRVLLVEVVVEANDRNNFGALRDVHVMTVCNGGRERSQAEYQALLEQSGFRLQRVFNSPIISVLEGLAQ